MADPQIVPPTPTITQPSSPSSDVAIAESIQRSFDKVMPAIKTKPTPESPPAPVATEPAPEPTPPTPKPSEPTPSPSSVPKPDDVDVPSFLEQALRSEEPPPPAAPAEEEWPEELPTFKNSDEAKARYKKWREAHKTMREELATARQTPATDPQQAQKIQILEQQNRQMQESLARFGVENSAEFQQQIIAPLTASWNEAARIVHESGGDVKALGHAMSMTGRAQFEALDDIFANLPESARSEANDALRMYRRYEDARKAYLKEAPKTFEAIQQRETERQLGEMNKQRDSMKTIFDQAAKFLRDQKLEVLMRTELPEGDWWNKQADTIMEQAKNLYLENTDMQKVAMACLLAPSAEAYRRLWLNSQKKIGQLQRVIKDRIGNEPDLSERGGPGGNLTSEEQFKADLSQPFDKVFLREFHKQQAQGR